MLFYPVKDGVWTGEPPITPAKGQNLAGYRRAASAPAGNPGKQYRWVGGSTVWIEEDAGTPAPVVSASPSLPILTHLEFLRLLRPVQIGRWRRRVKAALEADPPTEMDDVIVAADQHFAAAKAVDMGHDETQAACYIMYAEGAFGPFYDGTGSPSSEQLSAIAEADRVARAERP